jgi:putative heme transporter
VRRRWWWRILRGVLSLTIIALGIYFLAARAHEIQNAWGLVRRTQLRWLGAAVLFEFASMIVFARLQRGLLRAGGVSLPLRTMTEITVAGNAVAATLPGGVAWAAAWVFGQLSRRGVDRFLRVWVFLVAGAVSSFALFLVVGGGIWLAGNRGPVAGLRWGVLVLAMIPVAALILFPLRSSAPARRSTEALKRLVSHLPGGRQMARAVRSLFTRIERVHLSPAGWAEVLILALLNWLYDCAVLVMSLLALGIHVPWRGIFVIYGITQIAAALPITPGGLGVVEGTLAALLHAYGVPTEQAIAAVIVYRFVSFWGFVPIGWTAWISLDVLQRRGRRRTRAHPWAFHRHLGIGNWEAPSETRVLLPEPEPCTGCDEQPSADGATRVAGSDGSKHGREETAAESGDAGLALTERR